MHSSEEQLETTTVMEPAATPVAVAVESLSLKERAAGVVRGVRSIYAEGIGLAPAVGVVREALNEQLAASSSMRSDLSGTVKSLGHTARANWHIVRGHLGNATQLGERHPELLLGGTAVAVGVPSLLFGVRSAVFNTAIGVGAAATGLYLGKRSNLSEHASEE